MKTLMLIICLLIGSPALASTLTFEPGASVDGWSAGSYLPTVSHAQWESDWQNTIAFPSGDFAAYNTSGVNWLSMTGPLSLVEGAWLAPWTAFDTWYDPYSAHAVEVEGYGSGQLIGNLFVPLEPGFHYTAFGFAEPIDTLVFRTNTTARQWYLLDDMNLTVLPRATIREAVIQAVPEPSSLCYLLAAGLAVGLGASWMRLVKG